MPEVTLSAMQNATTNERIITVRDNGLGIDLSIVKKVVDRRGSQIQLRSQLGAGSCFEIRLPYRQATAHKGSSHALRLSVITGYRPYSLGG